jgi:PAS domain S-box-containing protein
MTETAPNSPNVSALEAAEITMMVFDVLPDAVLISDEGGIIQLVNQQAEIMFGYQRDELFGQPIEILLPADLCTVHERHREDFWRAPYVRRMGIGLVLLGKAKHGAPFPIEVAIGPLTTASGQRYVVSSIRLVVK